VAREVIFERLNPLTGDVTFQVPSRETLREEAHAAEIGTAEPQEPASTNGDEPGEAVATDPTPANPSGAAKGASISILV
jgi:hypothetical protein